MRRRDASPRAGGDEGAMAALLPRVEPIELLARPLAPGFLAIVDGSGRLCELTGETRARVERAVGPDRVRVLLVHVARAVVHAVVRRKSVALGLFAEKRHLVVDEIAVVAGGSAARTCRCHTGAVQHLVALADRNERNHAFQPGRFRADHRLEVHLHQLVGEVLLAEELHQRRVTVDRPLLEIPADRNAAPAGALADVLPDAIEVTPPA